LALVPMALPDEPDKPVFRVIGALMKRRAYPLLAVTVCWMISASVLALGDGFLHHLWRAG
jgi:hypothetical protein